MDIQSRIDLVKQVGEEIITEDELRELLETKKNLIAYDGFEPSGNLHVAQSIMRTININKMINAGCTFKMLVADWHAYANNKYGGDLHKIQTAGKYMIEVWKACGMNMDKVQFVWANDAIVDRDYWNTVMNVATHSTVKRIIRCCQIMGRRENDALHASHIFYPCMQAADIFHLKVDIAQLGMDQRKVNVLAREVGPKIGTWKPVAVHHHMLQGLGQPPQHITDPVERTMALKMSKSKPETAIFTTDSEEEIAQKIQKAYCPQKIVYENPILEYYKYILCEKFADIVIERPIKFGGDVSFGSYRELEDAYARGDIHPLDLKKTVVPYMNELLHPIRNHFATGPAKKLFDDVQSFTVTR